MYKMQICFGFKIFFFFFFFKHKLHVGQILNFSRYLLKHPEIDCNYPKFFLSGIGTPWTKFPESPLIAYILNKDNVNRCRKGQFVCFFFRVSIYGVRFL